MKKLLRAVATSSAPSGETNSEERASSRILKQVFGGFRSTTPNRLRSATTSVVIDDGQEAGVRERSSRRHASASFPCPVDSYGPTQAALPSSEPGMVSAGAIDVTSRLVKGAAALAAEHLLPAQSLADNNEEQQQHLQKNYETWDTYLAPNGLALAFMSAPPVEVVDYSTELLFQANVQSSGQYPGVQEDQDFGGQSMDARQFSEEESAEAGFASDAGPLGRQDDGGHLLSSALSRSRRSLGASSSTPQGDFNPAHAAILANGLARQPGVNLNMDYNSEIYLTDTAPIGQGQFGSVYRGVYAEKSVAIKLLPKMFLGDASPADVETFIQEAAVLSGVDHPNVVKFYGGSLNPPYVFIVEELMERSLADVLYKSPQESFPLRRVLSVGLDVASGLHYLHCCNPAIVHRDLKPENILLDANGTAKISDFGLARCKYQSYVKTNRREAGSLAYMAPECFDARMGKLTDRLDVFSFGVLLWVMLTREFPWQGMRTHEFLQRMVIGGSRLAVPQDDNVCPLALRRLLSSCWADMPAERPSCEEICAELERMLKYTPTDS